MSPARLRLSASLLLAAVLALTGCGPSEDAPPAAGPGQLPEPRDVDALMDELLALGYVQASRAAPRAGRVSVYDRERAQPGLNLAVSGHAPEAVLFDMEGRVLHRWARAFSEIWPEREPIAGQRFHRYWRRVHLLPNGYLLAIFDGLGLVCLTPDSRVAWTYDGGAHHDLDVTDDGRIFVLTRAPRAGPVGPRSISEDFLVILAPDGRELRRVSLLEAMRTSNYAGWLRETPPVGDLFHTNTVEVLDGRLAHLSPSFRRGNVLLSLHRLHAVAVLDLEAERIVWALRGGWRYQHQPTALEGGRLLLFDNLGKLERSRVLEIDPISGHTLWSYEVPDDPGAFFSYFSGSNQRLPNGNTLITESDGGRAFEVDRAGEIVWEYWNPHRVEVDGQERIASLFEVVRLPADLPLDWATRPEAPASAGAP